MKFKHGDMLSSGQPVKDYIDSAVRHVLLRQVCFCSSLYMIQLFCPQHFLLIYSFWFLIFVYSFCCCGLLLLTNFSLLSCRVFLVSKWRSCLIGILKGNKVLKLPSLILSLSTLQRRRRYTTAPPLFCPPPILRCLLLLKDVLIFLENFTGAGLVCNVYFQTLRSKFCSFFTR